MERRIIAPGQLRNHHSRECPACGGRLHRVRRNLFQRATVLFYPAKRYRCTDPKCAWEGLLRSHQFLKERAQFLDRAKASKRLRALVFLALTALGSLVALVAWLVLR